MNSSKHFSADELACKCGCGTGEMDADFLKWLEVVRIEFGKPMVISSGYRCPQHNAKVSKTGLTGPHTTGKAVDVLCAGGDFYELLNIVVEEGARGMGVKQNGEWKGRFFHLDMLNRTRAWSY